MVLKKLYQLRHFIALSCMIGAFFIIKKVTVLLYVPMSPAPDFLSLITLLWQSESLFLRFIIMINFIVKPLFVYLFIIFLFKYLKHNSNNDKI